MGNMGLYLLNECYGTFLCVAVVASFLIVFKNYEKSIIRLFSLLCVLVLASNIGGAAKIYLENKNIYNIGTLILSWLCFLAVPSMIVTTGEIILRKEKRWIKWLVAVPEFFDIAVTSTCFFGPWCFALNESKDGYINGPLIYVPRLMPVVYLLILVIIAFLNVKKSKMECVIVLIGSFFIWIDLINERVFPFSENLREITVSISVLAYFMYFTAIRHRDEVKELNHTFAESEEKFTKEMVDQTIETLAYTIDAKDRYTRGHSFRVAKYARMIAQTHGMSETECEQIYRAGLLHDIGKIAVKGSIINKPGSLDNEEVENIEKHPENGAKILEKMKSLPYLMDGAKYHHERYDGTGYPCGLKGEEIPEIARIIAVADAYDAMASSRSYRPTLDQPIVKQEIWKGMGTEFDPHFARIMISLMDADAHYDMREKPDEVDVIDFDNAYQDIKWPEQDPKNLGSDYKRLQDTNMKTLGAFICAGNKWDKPFDGVPVTMSSGRLTFVSKGSEDAKYVWCAPAVVVYSSKDGKLLGPKYEEMGVFLSAGYSWRAGDAIAKKFSFTKKENFVSWDNWIARNKEGLDYTVNFRKENDEVFVHIYNELITVEGSLQFPMEYSKDIYLAITGECCEIEITG